MRAVIQRVSSAKVIANGLLTGEIAKGFVILLGIEHVNMVVVILVS